MGKVRELNQKKYGISKYRFRELYYLCLQYNEWKDELKYKNNTVQSIQITDSPSSGGNGNATESLAFRRTALQEKCKIIEETAKEAAPDIYQYIMKAVTNDWVTYIYLKNVMEMPCGKDKYYERRRKFYWLLSEKI